MATIGKSKSFQTNLLVSIGGIFLLFAICTGVYQYQREKKYKIDILHSRLQMFNYEMVQTLGETGLTNDSLFYDYVARHNVEGLRVSVISNDGRVLLDSYHANVDSLGNHLQRTEIQQALAEGSGYDIKRTSQSTNETYFYSATSFTSVSTPPHHGGGARRAERIFLVRAAVPYSAELTESLKADNTFIYFTIALTLLLGVALYWNTSRIGRHIGYLREFAVKAEQGEELDHELERRLPDDELGDISHTIIQLYWKLRHSEEDKQRIKRQLTQNAAHELKTPASSIHGYLESILENPDMPADKREHFLERCYAQSERMNKLLMDMSILTKLSLPQPLHKRGDLDTSALIDVVPIINNVLADTALQLEQKGIIVEKSLPENITINSPIADAEDVVYSIFRNLFDNSIAYADGATKIRISYQDGCFLFSDNGCGVEPEHLPHLFERFYRVDKGRSRKLGGTGLGLAIVKNAVAAHGGTVSAETTPGGGLTIRFSFQR